MLTEGEKLCTVDLLYKLAHFDSRVSKSILMQSSNTINVGARRSTVLSLPL
jgi:hypothetical protein